MTGQLHGARTSGREAHAEATVRGIVLARMPGIKQTRDLVERLHTPAYVIPNTIYGLHKETADHGFLVQISAASRNLSRLTIADVLEPSRLAKSVGNGKVCQTISNAVEREAPKAQVHVLLEKLKVPIEQSGLPKATARRLCEINILYTHELATANTTVLKSAVGDKVFGEIEEYLHSVGLYTGMVLPKALSTRIFVDQTKALVERLNSPAFLLANTLYYLHKETAEPELLAMLSYASGNLSRLVMADLMDATDLIKRSGNIEIFELISEQVARELPKAQVQDLIDRLQTPLERSGLSETIVARLSRENIFHVLELATANTERLRALVGESMFGEIEEYLYSVGLYTGMILPKAFAAKLPVERTKALIDKLNSPAFLLANNLYYLHKETADSELLARISAASVNFTGLTMADLMNPVRLKKLLGSTDLSILIAKQVGRDLSRTQVQDLVGKLQIPLKKSGLSQLTLRRLSSENITTTEQLATINTHRLRASLGDIVFDEIEGYLHSQGLYSGMDLPKALKAA